jgi:predicted ester cyclase
MNHGHYWTDTFMWYGPAGIGSTRGLDGFRAHHQIPFLRAYNDREGAGHYIRISDGPYAVTGGWPSVRGTHTGEWLGMAPTGRMIEMRVMDFYRLEGDKIAENWVPMDVIHIALQMGVDLFARARHMTGQPDLTL